MKTVTGQSSGRGLIFSLPDTGQFDPKLIMVAPPDIDGLPPAGLTQLLLKLPKENAEQRRVGAEMRREIARLKRLKGRPSIKPPAAWRPAPQRSQAAAGRAAARGKVVPRVAVEAQILKAAVPAGARFKGYEGFVVQDLELRVGAIRYRRERWVTSDGHAVIAPLPAGVSRHFGAELRRFVLMHYHQMRWGGGAEGWQRIAFGN